MKKIQKWLDSDYGYHTNLFLDFEDKILRYVPSIATGYIGYEKDYFIDNILDLENCLILEVKKDEANKLKLAKEKERREEESRLKIEMLKKDEWKYKRDTSPDFEFYRYCFSEPIFHECFEPFVNEIFEYHKNEITCAGIRKVYHSYFCVNGKVEINYVAYSRITEVRNSRNDWKKSDLDFKDLFAEIDIRFNHQELIKFKRDSSGVISILSENIS